MTRSTPRILLALAVLACVAAAVYHLARHRARGPERPRHQASTPAVATTPVPGDTGRPATPAIEGPSGLGAPKEAAPERRGKMGRVDGFVHTPDGRPAVAVVSVQSFATPPNPPLSTKSGPDGKFSFDVPVGTWVARAEAPGQVSAPATLLLNEGQTAHLDLTLLAAAAITGVVTDPDGAPAVGAQVSSYYTIPTGENAGSAKPFRDFAAAAPTDERGRYRLVVLPGTHYLKAEKEGLAPAFGQASVVPGGESRCDLQLQRGLQIAGRVKDKAGNPVEGATVSAIWYSQSEGTYGGYYTQTGESGADGRYAVTGLREGKHTMSASAKGYAQESKYTVAAGAKDVDFVLGRAGRIEGKVVRKADGQPVDSPTVTCRILSQTTWEQNSVTIGKEGEFTVDGVGVGKHVVTAGASGFAPSESPEIDVAAEQTVSGVVIELSSGGTLRGTALSTHGRAPIQGASVAILQKIGMMDVDANSITGAYGAAPVTDAEGRFVWEHVPPGRPRVRVSHEEYASSTKTITIEEGKDAEEEFLLSEGAKVHGKVLGYAGRPRTGVQVSCANMSYSDVKTAATDEDGKYEIKGLAAGTWIVMIYDLGSGDASAAKMNSRTVQVTEGGTAEADFLPSDGVRLHGAVRQGGKVRANVQMQFIGTSGGGAMLSCQTDASGNYELTGARPGQYSVVVETTMVKCAIPDGQQDVQQDFDLPTGTISGHVYDARSRAKLEGAEVQAYHAGAAKGGMADFLDRYAGEAKSDSDGAYSLSGLSAGDYVIQVTKEGYAATIGNPISMPADGSIGGKDFLLAGGAEIHGVVHDGRGHPVVGATFSLRDRKTGTPVAQTELWTTRSDEQGAFKLPGIREGEYMLAVHADGHASAQRVVRVTPGHDASVELVLSAAGTIRIRVKDASGAPVANATLSLLDAAGNPVESAIGMEDLVDPSRWKSGADGRIERGGIAPGHYRGEVVEGNRAGSFETDVAEGGVAEASVTLQERR